MQLIYVIQLVFLVGAFALGYRVQLSPYRTVGAALVWQLGYGLVIWTLFDPHVAVLDVFDMTRLSKEYWLPDLVKWIGKQAGRDIRFRYDATFLLLTFAGGLLVTISMILAGGLLYQGLHTVRRTELRLGRNQSAVSAPQSDARD